jgi:hypothetical protein
MYVRQWADPTGLPFEAVAVAQRFRALPNPFDLRPIQLLDHDTGLDTSG